MNLVIGIRQNSRPMSDNASAVIPNPFRGRDRLRRGPLVLGWVLVLRPVSALPELLPIVHGELLFATRQRVIGASSGL
jgi:hypothetical protein